MQLGPRSESRKTIGASFDPRHNSLNALRLGFALLVIVSHSMVLGAYRSEIVFGKTSLGSIAVDGFFAISGFLITASAARSSTGRYIWQRFLRIYPGAWVALLFIAFVLAPSAWLYDHGSLGGFFTAPDGPFRYLAHDFTVGQITQSPISGTPRGVPVPGTWTGSWWTLEYELMCYILVGALAVIGVVRRRWALTVVAVTAWLVAVARFVESPNSPRYANELRFFPIFLAGALLWAWRDRIFDSWALAAAAGAVFVGGSFLSNPDVIAGPALAYLCIWLSIHLPLDRVGARNDLSYGVYIYAFGVQELLAVWGVTHWGYFPYTLLSTAVTLCLATASWTLVEKRALRAKKWTPRVAWSRSSRPAHRRSAIPIPKAPPPVTPLRQESSV